MKKTFWDVVPFADYFLGDCSFFFFFFGGGLWIVADDVLGFVCLSTLIYVLSFITVAILPCVQMANRVLVKIAFLKRKI